MLDVLNDSHRRRSRSLRQSHQGADYTLRDFLISATYHRRLILVAFLVPVLLGLVAATFSGLGYVGQARLLLLAPPNETAASGTGLSASTARVRSPSIESEMEILTSRDVLTEVVNEIGLQELYPQNRLQRLSRNIRYSFSDPSALFTGSSINTDEAVGKLRDDLSLSSPADSNVVSIRFTHTDRQLTVRTIDSLISHYLARRQGLVSDFRYQFLTNEVERYRQDLRDIELSIEEMKTQHNVIDLPRQIAVSVDNLINIEQQIAATSALQSGTRAELAMTQQRLATMPERILDWAEFSYNGGTPGTSERQERNRTPAPGLQTDPDAVEQQLEALNRQRSSALTRLEELRSVESRLAALERSHDIKDEAYREYSLRAEAARVEEHAMTQNASNVRVIDEASAASPPVSSALGYAAAGALGGTVLAFVAGLGAAWNRQVFVSPNEAERALGMPILTTFNQHDETADLPGAQSEITYLAAQLNNLRDAAQERRMCSFQFLPADGAGVDRRLTVSVARSLVRNHRCRVLVIDLHEQYPLADDSIRIDVDPDRVDGLWRMRGAALQPDSAFSGSVQPLHSVVSQLGMVFDIVLVNAPPPDNGHAALHAAKGVDANIIVLRAEETRRPTAVRYRDDILASGGDILGAVLLGRVFHLPARIYRWI